MNLPALAASGLEKSFGGTRALASVDFAVNASELHALVGENGAGKSTLIRILSGALRADAGELRVADSVCRFASPHNAIAAGIVAIPQELRLVPALSIAENLALGDLPVRGLVIDRKRMASDAAALLAELAYDADPTTTVARLPFAERQIVAIARALRRCARVLILDEPTAAIERREAERLFAVLERMKARGVAIVYVSHRLEEVIALADRCTVLRDGRVAAERRRGEFDAPALIAAMTGSTMAPRPAAPLVPGAPLIAAGGSAVREREIVGLAGLLGSGTGEVLRRLFGVPSPSPAAAIKAGRGMVPGDRALGLVPALTVRENILLPSLGRVGRREGKRIVAELMELLDIRPRQPELPARALSGGNQQKVIFAKWLASRTRVLLLEEPTQGIDVAAKAQIHGLIRKFAADGGGVLMTSSDLDELIDLATTVLALRRGRGVEPVDRADLDSARLLAAIGG